MFLYYSVILIKYLFIYCILICMYLFINPIIHSKEFFFFYILFKWDVYRCRVHT